MQRHDKKTEEHEKPLRQWQAMILHTKASLAV